MMLENILKNSGSGVKRNQETFIFIQSIFLAFSIVLFFTLRLQAQVTVTGEIKSEDGQPVPFANVLFLQPEDSLLVLGGITNEEGRFNLNVRPATYLLNVSMMGYTPYYSSMALGNIQKQVHHLSISLSENVQELGEIVVNGKRPVFEKEADRTIINVQNSVTSAGNTVLEVLEKSPGVTVDRQSGSIVLNGKAGVLVMINNKMNRLPLDAVVQMLDGMSAANIGKIELIANPPAKFDAEGNAGIIHIVMKDNPDLGTNGSFGLTLGYNYAETLAGNFSLNHRSERLNVLLNYSLRHDHNQHLSQIESFRQKGDFIQTDRDSSIRNPKTTVQNLNAGIEYKITSSTTLNFQATGYKRKWDNVATTFNFFEPAPDSLFITEMKIEGLNIWKSSGAGLGLNHNFTEQQKLHLSVDYLYYLNNNPASYNNTRRNSNSPVTEKEMVGSKKRTPIHFRIAKLDYSNQFSPQFSMEAGLKGTLSDFTNDVKVTRMIENEMKTDPFFTSNSSLDEKIYAAYLMMKWNSSEKWNFHGGIRYEFTDTYLYTADDESLLDRRYGSLFPTVFSSYQLSEENQVQFSYSKRISRPTYNEMAPYVFFFGLNTFVSGNLSLNPAISDRFDLSYIRKKFWVTLRYSHTNNTIASYQSEFNSEMNSVIYRSQNMKFTKNYGISFNFPLSVTDWWRIQNDISVYHTILETKHLENNIRNENNNLTLTINNTLKMMENLSAEISGFYQSPVMRGFTKFITGGAINIGVQKKFKNDAVIALVMNDIFQTSTWITEIERENFRSRWDYDSGIRSVNLTYRHQFGNKKLKEVNIKTGAEDERKRVQ